MELQTIVYLFAIYAAISIFAPRILANPRLVSSRPGFVLITWFVALTLAAASLLAALIGLVSRALAQYTTESHAARIIVPLLEYIFGWIAIAALGILLFRFIASMSELRSQAHELEARFATLRAQGEATTIDGRNVLICPSSETFLMAVPSQNYIMVSTHIVNTLPAELLAAALAHEQAHLDQHHGTLRSAAVLAMAVAPGFSASERMAQATRITTELLADDAAAQHFSKKTVASALRACFGSSPLVEERIARLER